MRLILNVASLLLLATASPTTGQTPLERYHFDQSAKSSFDPIFAEQRRGVSGPRVYVTVGDLDHTIATGKYRPDAVVVPTNTSGELEAGFPITQQVFVNRVRSNPVALSALRHAIQTAQHKAGSYEFLQLGTGSLTVEMPAAASVPRLVCLLATDNRGGGSIDQRDFFYQDRISAGVGGCLRGLEASGARSVALPLVGSAMFATADGALNGSERALVKCRMLNSASGIARALGALPNTTRLQDISIVIWRHDLERLFGNSASDPRRADFAQFAQQVRATVARGLAGRVTTAGEVGLPQCQVIFGLNG
jgi:hypothetical protein